MTQEQQGLVIQNSNVSCLEEVKFSKEQAKTFAHAVTMMSLAKNIKLSDGCLSAWEYYTLEDIKKGKYTLIDFIEATKKVVRIPLFNRIDFSDIYIESLEIAKIRRSREKPTAVSEPIAPMPDDVRSSIMLFKLKGVENGN